jgi:hypothetical protein
VQFWIALPQLASGLQPIIEALYRPEAGDRAHDRRVVRNS